MNKPLLSSTKILLVIWALVTILGGLLLIFYPPFATAVVWPAPLAVIPAFHAQLNGAIALGTGVASILALWQNSWAGARPIIGLYVAYAIAAEYVALTAIFTGAVPFQVWFYVILGLVYLAGSWYIWPRQQTS